MPPAKRAQCQVCNTNEFKYTCARCGLIYCSVPCYKVHKETCEPGKSTVDSKPTAPILGEATAVEKQTDDDESQARSIASDEKSEQANQADSISPRAPLRSLASLKWPYIPEESAYPDPLKRDDPKPLQLHQYEAMASSTAIRRTLTSHPRLPELLRSIDKLRGPEREEALEQALGVRSGSSFSAPSDQSEDIRALRELAEAVEAAVRGGKQDVLGLDWGD